MTLKTWVQTSVNNLKNYFYLNDWTIDLIWDEDDSDPGCAAAIRTDSRYLKAGIYIYPTLRQLWEKEDYETVKECLVHEFTHILLNPVMELANKSRSDATSDFYQEILEQQTQRTSLIIGRGIPKNIFPKV